MAQLPMSTPFSDSTETRVRLGHVDSVPMGQGRCFTVNGAKLAVFRLRDGRVFAIDAACPHRGGPLAYGLIGAGVVICPLHAYRFRLEDGSGVDTDLGVRTHPIEIHEGSIFLLPRQAA